MKNYKGNMLLIELVIVILFFSLSQVVLVQVFAGAQITTRRSERLNTAMLEAQNWLERASIEVEPEQVLVEQGFSAQNDDYAYASANGVEYVASVQKQEQPTGLLVTVEISAKYNGEELFVMPSVRYFPKEAQYEQ